MRAHLALVFITLFATKMILAQTTGPLEEFAQIINQVQLEKKSDYQIGQTTVAENCTVFMTKDFFMGPLGQNIVRQITETPTSYGYLLHGGSLNKYCPKYSTMLARQKALVWVMIMTVMAHFESSCEPNRPAQGPNGTAYGYFQLHKGHENEYSNTIQACPKNASLDPKRATSCALAMLESQMQRTGGDLFDKNSYWDVLRPQGELKKANKIAAALYRSSLCNPKIM